MSCQLIARFCNCPLLVLSVGNILDHPHYSWAGVLLCQLRNQPLRNFVWWFGSEGGRCVQARKICDYPFRQSGLYETQSCFDSVFEVSLSNWSFHFFCLPLQSSKCRSVFTSAQKLEGYKRLDRQLAQFNDYNFVFTSYAKNRQQNQQSWGLRMRKRKRRKKKGGRTGLPRRSRPYHPVESLLSSSLPLFLPLCCRHHSESAGADAVTSPSLTSSLSFLHCCTCDLDLLHESSFLCFDILAHSCCDLEVHVEELNTLCLRMSTCAQYNGPFLQVSPLIPHRQGFRPH